VIGADGPRARMTPPRLALPTDTVGARSSSQGPSSLAASGTLVNCRVCCGRSTSDLGGPTSGATPIGAVLAGLVTPGPRGTFRIVVRASGCAVRVTHRSGRGLQVERLTGEPSAPSAPITQARPAPMMDDQSSARSSVADDEGHTQPVFAGTVGVDRSSRYATFLPWVPSGGLLPDAGWGSGRDVRTSWRNATPSPPAPLAGAGDPGQGPVRTAGGGAPGPGDRLTRPVRRQLGLRQSAACPAGRTTAAAALPGRGPAACGGGRYASFNYGRGERAVGARRFTDLDRAGRAALRQAPPWFTGLDTRVPADRRPGREAERWLHILLQTRGGDPVARTAG